MSESRFNSSRWTRLSDAAAYALLIHAEQLRKGSEIPYISHLFAVASLVLEHGGDEEQSIAGLLHDAIEDCGAGQEAEIAERFGPRVAYIVQACTDADTQPKPPWKERKEAYVIHLETELSDALLVSCCDKLHNARAILTDQRTHGDALFDRFKGGKEGTLWYYRSLSEIFLRRLPGALSIELARTVREIDLLGQVNPANGKRLSSTGSHRGEPAHLADEVAGPHDPFRAHMAARCRDLAAEKTAQLIAEIRGIAKGRGPWFSDRKNFWEEFACSIAKDETYHAENYLEEVRGICRDVVNHLSKIEREILEICTLTYQEFWRPDEPEPDGEERCKWIVNELCSEIWTLAEDEGWRLNDAEENSETDEDG